MKIQCSCGAKYSFEVTPEMAQNPMRFVCQNCGLDSSDYINELVRDEIAKQFPNTASPPPPAAPVASQLRISREEKTPEPPQAAPVSGYCSRHRNTRVTEKCAICGKPICPQCLELFGFFCSPLCKSKAELQGVAAPVYAGQKFRVQARFWRKAGLILSSLGAVLALVLGFWTWYAWFGSVPHPHFSARFDDTDRAYSGATQLVGKDQIVFLHGGTLARYDLKTKKPVWSLELITKDQIAEVIKWENDLRARENQSGEGFPAPPPGSQERGAKIALQHGLSLHVSGQNIWVVRPDKLMHYDWDTGRILQDIPLPQFHGELVSRPDELLVPGTGAGAPSITHISLANGAEHTEEFHDPGAVTVTSTQNTGGSSGNSTPGAAAGQPPDAQKFAEQAQNLNLPGRIALPALLANEIHEQQIMAELKDNNPGRPRPANARKPRRADAPFTLVPDQNGYLQIAVRLLEEHIVTREAMKAPPKKSALNGDLSVANSTEAANEMLNEMQRNNGGGNVSEDQSRYQVTLHRPDSTGTPDWTGEVIGPPQLFTLKTVNVLAAGRSVIVFDKANKKLWEASLTYPISAGQRGFGEAEPQFGAGPCVEHGNLLYVFDQAVLSAYDLATGNARWRLPSIGVVGLFFDDQGMVYVNTTTGNPDDIKYARQIDITKSTEAVLLKVDPRTGKILWSVKPGGYICYLSGKYIYTVQSYDPNPTDAEVLSDTLEGLQKPPCLHIARINPKNGRIMWDHYQDRAPVYFRFQDNSIELVFKKEVQVLTYLSL
ncbi:MAG: PQQ-binding-like beta-propeller repeat protein [Verrucomicrobiia bacterium]